MVLNATTLNRVIAKVGSEYQVRVGSTTFNDYGDSVVSWTNFTNGGVVNILTDESAVVRAGIMNIGDAEGYFRSDSNIVPGSLTQVLHQGRYYEVIGDPIIEMFSGAQLVKRVFLRKVVT